MSKPTSTSPSQPVSTPPLTTDVAASSEHPPIASQIRTEARSRATLRGDVHSTSCETHATTRWLALRTISYRLPHDAIDQYPRRWDMATRTSSSRRTYNTSDVDAVVVLARLRFNVDHEMERILLVKQFRPAVNAVTVELPAGLVDDGEDIRTAACRELREETGFVGVVHSVHPSMPLSPGMSDERVALVEVHVTQPPGEQRLEETENIHVVSVPLHRLEEALMWMRLNEGVVVMHSVAALALGLRVGARLDMAS